MTVRREITLEHIPHEPATIHAPTDLATFHIPQSARDSPLLVVSRYSLLVLLKLPTEGHKVILR